MNTTRSLARLCAAAMTLCLLACTDAFAQVCDRTITADVVALDQAFYNNRMGAIQAGGMIFALRRDVVSIGGAGGALQPGYVMLRPDKRPRPMVLRMNVGDCLRVRFQNLLGASASVFSANAGNQRYPVRVLAANAYTGNQNAKVKQSAQTAFDPLAAQPATRMAGVHVMGLNLVSAEAPPGTAIQGVSADGSWVGANDPAPANPQVRASGLVGPGQRITYTYVASAEGAFLLYSTAANVGDQLGFGGQLMQGLFGSVTVQPRGAEWYRSQVTKVDLDLAADGKTADGHPIVNYDKVYPPAHPRAGQPILKMLDAKNEIVYTDLTAIITGPKHGAFECPGCPTNPSYPNGLQPFREFAIHYHDDFVSTQAFEEFRKHASGNNNEMSYTLQGSRDFFAINYGMAGIGPEVWANRIKVGPMHDCATCRFEEFFLSSWAVGDPAMVVDFPANSIDPATNNIKLGPKATRALYPDDPSNVYHSYMSDHVKFQIIHAGTNISHVHHLHAHQWLHSPKDDQSSYRDSQMISPGAAYTLEHTYNGSGNKNKTVGDSIFHCHFYPHFAQGMWSLWRVHDVFEGGTALDNQGRPVAGFNRALPDGEIARGTPIPALVPMPTLPMAPIGAQVQIVPLTVPGSGQAGFRAEVNMADPNIKNGPGFPFFIPGVAGQRITHPPLDFAPDPADAANPFLNGGLPRFLALKEVGKPYEKHNRWDFTKLNDELKAIELPEAGTDVEKISMAYHAQRFHNTFRPDGSAANGASGFVLNGRPPISGAPFADPAVELDGTPVCPENKPPCLMRYKAADIQLNLVFNKKGQHYPQARMITLWGDVKDTLDNKKAPEPFFFRSNSTQIIEYWLANLVPNYYELDDFQVRTPTDILGQHIHLVKFDVTSSDGAGNGFNYEDGTLSPKEVQELIENINKAGGLFTGFDFNAATAKKLTAKTIPYFGPGTGNEWMGAQATIQRWYADPVISNSKSDRTLRTIFTHDHFGPSTHQQVGLYAGLLVEPTASQWQDPVSGVFLGTNLNRPVGANGQPPDDGGPTGWQANIITTDRNDSFREFALEFQDRQLAYKAISKNTLTPYVHYPEVKAPCTPTAPWGWADPGNALSPPLDAPAGCLVPPYPSIVTLAFQTGGYSLNYRNEPLAFRVNPNIGVPTALQTNLSSVFRSIQRADTSLNVQPTGQINSLCAGTCFTFPPAQTGVENFDPYTPLLRAYEGDKVQIRTLVGAHMSPHFFTTHGVNWLFEPTSFNATDNTSGYRGTQGMGISEHYEMLFTLPRTDSKNGSADYLYSSSSDVPGLSNGNWGLMRAYRSLQPAGGPVPLPNNQPPANLGAAPAAPAICPATAPKRNFNVVAAFAREVLNGPVVYNARGRAGAGGSQKLVNWNALAYFLEEDLDPITGRLLPGKPVEPVILRANAGDCINITLKNRIPDVPLSVSSPSVSGIPISTSRDAGLHPQLVAFDVTRSNGVDVGKNPPMAVAPGAQGQFTWYTGKIETTSTGTNYIPIEFGSIPLTPTDPLRQHPYGLLGALIIEPVGATWRADDNSRAQALVCKGPAACTEKTMLFREFVAVIQDDVAGLRETVPRYGAPNTITILGTMLNGKPTWLLNGKPLPPQGLTLNPGQTVNFEIGMGTHGLLFKDEATARAAFDIDGSPDKAKFQTFPSQCMLMNAFGTAPQASGHIATLTVRQVFTLPKVDFLCSQHCQNMTGSFNIQLPVTEEAPFTYTRAVNYRTEPLDYRYSVADWLANVDAKSPVGISRAVSNSLVLADPQTPIFAASNNMPVRFRVLHPAGLVEQVFTLHGHVWQEEPYVNGSREIGNNPKSQAQGSRDSFGPNVAFDAVIDRAGGPAGTIGDYLYRTFVGSGFQFGMWGLLRVGEAGKDSVTITSYLASGGGRVLVSGTTTVNPGTGQMAGQVTIFDTTGGTMTEMGKVAVDPMTGAWPASGDPFSAPSRVTSILVRSAGGGEARAARYGVPVQTRSSTPRDLPNELSLFNPEPRRAEVLVEAAGSGGTDGQWLRNGLPLENATIRVRPGDTVTVAVRQGEHDLTFADGDQARRVFKFEMPGSPFAQRPAAGARAIGTNRLGGGSVLATLTVRTDIPAGPARVTFRSAADDQRMVATFEVVR